MDAGKVCPAWAKADSRNSSGRHETGHPVLADPGRSGRALAACNDDALQSVADKANQPLPQEIVAKMKSEGMTRTSPIMMRIFKEEGVLEIWKQKDNGRYGKIADYKICAWSGKLGPKKKEGDRQAPEGFYLIKPVADEPGLALLPRLQHRLSERL